MIKLGLVNHLSSIEETCINAQKEYSLEKALERMIDEWEPVVLELKSHKDTGTHILTGTTCEEIQALLDDHIIKSQTMQASRYGSRCCLVP
jgi:dynein heavy chain